MGYLTKIMKSKDYKETKFEIIKKLSEKAVDFRHLITFKNNLFNSPHLSATNSIPVYEFQRARQEIEFTDIKNNINGVEDLILKECTLED